MSFIVPEGYLVFVGNADFDNFSTMDFTGPRIVDLVLEGYFQTVKTVLITEN